MKNKHGLWIIAIIALAVFGLTACDNTGTDTTLPPPDNGYEAAPPALPTPPPLPPPGAQPGTPPGTQPPPAGPPTQQPTFMVIFNLAGGIYSRYPGTIGIPRFVVQGQDAAPLTEDPTRVGYIFAGWYPALNLTNVTEDRTFTAQWN
ncbi:MAG: InlB B-repeat-containing protein [Treponema sp.]|jgi:uncharacterized repeat protein (TIGR02543 family)|nr:InlB B-repeat-containing protein [Treponema sp.]